MDTVTPRPRNLADKYAIENARLRMRLIEANETIARQQAEMKRLRKKLNPQNTSDL